MPSEAEINAVLDHCFASLTPDVNESFRALHDTYYLWAYSILCRLPQNAVNQAQCEILHQNSQRFGKTQSSIQKSPAPLTTSRPVSNTTDGLGLGNRIDSNELPGIEQPTKKPRGRPSKDPEKQGSRIMRDDSWYSVRTLTSLMLEEPLQDHLNTNSAHDPEIFLNSCRELLTIPTQESVPNIGILVRYCKTINTMQGEQIFIHT